jgi:hypothetical protein
MSRTTDDALDAVLRLHLLAEALPGSVVAERSLAAPFDRVWHVVSDLEVMVPLYERNVTAVEVIERSADQARIVATVRGGHVEEMEVRLAPGWCLMQSPSVVIAFGARPVGSNTLLAHLEHRRTSAAAPIAASRNRAHLALERELEAIEGLAAGPDGG